MGCICSRPHRSVWERRPCTCRVAPALYDGLIRSACPFPFNLATASDASQGTLRGCASRSFYFRWKETIRGSVGEPRVRVGVECAGGGQAGNWFDSFELSSVPQVSRYRHAFGICHTGIYAHGTRRMHRVCASLIPRSNYERRGKGLFGRLVTDRSNRFRVYWVGGIGSCCFLPGLKTFIL